MTEKLKTTTYYDKFILKAEHINGQNCIGKILLYVPKKQKTVIEVGNKIKVFETPKTLQNALNPNQFDYSRYLADKQIYAQIYCQKKDILVSKTVTKDIWYYCARLHSRIVSNLEKSEFNKNDKNN